MTQLSLEAIQQRHEELLKLNENAEISEADITQVEEFLKNLAAAGVYIEDSDQRSLLRAYIRYWANFVDDKTGNFPPTQLQPFSIAGLQEGGGTENVTGNLKTPVPHQDSPFDSSPAPRRSYLNFFRKPIRSSWLVAALTLLIIISVIIVFVPFRLFTSHTLPSPTPSPNATGLTPQEVRSWCSPIPNSSGTCNLSRFEQLVETGGQVNPNGVHMKPGDPVSFNVPAGISVVVWNCSKKSSVSGPIKLPLVCEASFYSIFTQVLWKEPQSLLVSARFSSCTDPRKRAHTLPFSGHL